MLNVTLICDASVYTRFYLVQSEQDLVVDAEGGMMVDRERESKIYSKIVNRA